MTINFENQVAIVTGAGGGLGRQHALELGRRGARVVVNDLGGDVDGSGGSVSAAELVSQEIIDNGGQAIANGASVSDIDSVQNMIDQIMAAWGRIDILVNNAGILRDKTFSKLEVSNWHAVLDVHLNGSMNCSKLVWPIMTQQNYGRIVMTTSTSGLFGNFGQSNYSAAKAGVASMTVLWAKELAQYDIRVAAVAPGFTATEMVMSLRDEVKNKFTSSVPLRRFAEPSEISSGVLFLLKNDYITGEILEISGGTRI